MFDIGASELAVIGVTALLVVGPERLPRLARVAGLYVGRARRVMQQMRSEIQRELDEQDFKSIRQIVQRGALELEDDEAPAAPQPAAASPAASPTRRADDDASRAGATPAPATEAAARTRAQPANQPPARTATEAASTGADADTHEGAGDRRRTHDEAG
jgi:sec-independent protein translocase protein TatB